MLLCGCVRFIPAGTTSQMLVTACFCFAWLAFIGYIHPYKKAGNNLFSVVCQLILMMTLMKATLEAKNVEVANAAQVAVGSGGDEQWFFDLVSVLTLLPLPLSLLISAHQWFTPRYARWQELCYESPTHKPSFYAYISKGRTTSLKPGEGHLHHPIPLEILRRVDEQSHMLHVEHLSNQMTGAAGVLHAEVKHVLSVVYSLGPTYLADFPPTGMQAAMDRLLQKVGVCVETLVQGDTDTRLSFEPEPVLSAALKAGRACTGQPWGVETGGRGGGGGAQAGGGAGGWAGAGGGWAGGGAGGGGGGGGDTCSGGGGSLREVVCVVRS